MSTEAEAQELEELRHRAFHADRMKEERELSDRLYVGKHEHENLTNENNTQERACSNNMYASKQTEKFALLVATLLLTGIVGAFLKLVMK